MTDDGYVGMAIIYTVCPRSLDPFHMAAYYIKMDQDFMDIQ